jgi:hypothetical protein
MWASSPFSVFTLTTRGDLDSENTPSKSTTMARTSPGSLPPAVWTWSPKSPMPMAIDARGSTMTSADCDAVTGPA